jgi:5-methylcytosine-specific restriction enzyme A
MTRPNAKRHQKSVPLRFSKPGSSVRSLSSGTSSRRSGVRRLFVARKLPPTMCVGTADRAAVTFCRAPRPRAAGTACFSTTVHGVVGKHSGAQQMPRREFSVKTKMLATARSHGHCEGCTAPLVPGHRHYDHIVPDQLGGEPTLENCQVLCTACHSVKTAKQDIPAIAKAKRREVSHLGAKAPSRNPMPGGKNTPWKIKMNPRRIVPR